ncbi:MAG: alpha/beta fold hydrolase [Candidatus Xenobiia bacterium LiM19]
MKSIAVAANFTVEMIEPSLQFLLNKIEYEAEIAFAPYNQIFQELYNPQSLLRSNQNGINVILTGLEEWLHYQKEYSDFSQARESVEKNVNELIAGISPLSQQKAPCIVCITAPSPALRSKPEDLKLHQQIEDFFISSLQEIKNIYPIRSTTIDTLYPVKDYFDMYTNQAGHIPYTEEYFAALGAVIARKIFSITSRQAKVIIADCDGTLWRGICGEVGSQVKVDAAGAFLQSLMIEKKNEGMVLCICSKNEYQSVEDVFLHNKDMVLSLDDIATWRINWEPKSSNIKSLGNELNLGLDSFIFLDDSSAEISEVSLHYPEVFSVLLPQAVNNIPTFLQHLWSFDRSRITEEDKERNKFYKENARRQEQQAHASSLGEYIESLQMKIEIKTPKEALIPRLSQLSQRTNQFNSTTLRLTEANIAELVNSESSLCRYISVSDRFGDYGIVGLFTGTLHKDTLTVNAFVMSCRAMSRGVEYKMLQDAGRQAEINHINSIEIEFIKSERNKPILDFFESLPFDRKYSDGNKDIYVIATDKAIACEFEAKSVAATEEKPEEKESESKSKKPGPPAGTLYPVLLYIAEELNSAEKIVHQVKQHNKKSAQHERGNFIAPSGPVETALCQLYEDLLNIDHVSSVDNFFDLGGFSLAATLLNSKISNIFKVQCTLETISQLKTPQKLAEYISTHGDDGQFDFTALQQGATLRFSEAVCHIDGHDLHYATIGKGETVVLLHGLFGRKEHCYEFANYLAPHFHVVIPDLPGFGNSTGYPESVYRYDNQIEILEKFFEAISLDRFHIAGNSMGASLSGIIAARYLCQVQSLGFLGPPSMSCPRESEVEKLARAGINISVPRTLDEFHQKIEHLFFVPPRVIQDQLDEIGRDEVAHYQEHIAIYDIVHHDDLLLDQYIKKIRVPTFVIWGDKDRFKDLSGAYFLQENIRHNQIIILPNAGHALFQEYPEAIAKSYIKFLLHPPH